MARTLARAPRNAKVIGIALAPDTKPNLFTEASIAGAVESHFCDIRDAEKTAASFAPHAPMWFFHMAAQPLVRESYRCPAATFATNVLGTVHVLEALRGHGSTRVAVVITTDKVYANREWPYPYREDDILGGHDPYSASKAACEIAVASYRQSFLDAQDIAVASTRAGNVIGGGDWSKDRKRCPDHRVAGAA